MTTKGKKKKEEKVSMADFLEGLAAHMEEAEKNKAEFPLEVAEFKGDGIKPRPFHGYKTGSFVSIRPCADEYHNKTYLGLFLGELPLGISASYDPKTKTVNLSGSYNPAIYVFELEKIIFGIESWWGLIESEADLKKITNQDINNVWYVKALKALDKKDGRRRAKG